MKKKIKKLIIKKARASRYDVDCDPFLEELIVNSEEIYDGLIASGKSSREAYQLTIKQIGDLDEYFNDKSVDDSCTFTRQRTIHNILSGSLILAAILLVGLFYLIERRPIWMYLVVNFIIIGFVVAKKVDINKKILLYQIFKNNIDRRFYFCLFSNFLIFLPTLLHFDFQNYLFTFGINIFLINLSYLLIVDKEIKPNFLLSIIALIFSTIYYSYSIHGIIMVFFISILVFTGVLYLKLTIQQDKFDYAFIIIGSILIILVLFLMDSLKLFEIIFISILLISIGYYIVSKKYDSLQKINKIKSLISIFIIFHVIGINVFLLSYYLENFYMPDFIPFRYILLLYHPTIMLIIIEYLLNFTYYLVLNYVYKKKGVYQ